MNIKRTLIERVRITGPASERDKAWAYVAEGDYRVIAAGPVMLEFPKVDPDRFGITAEREVLSKEDD